MNIKTPLIFGREPAAVLGLVEALLAVLLAFGLGVSQEAFGPILAVVTALVGVYVAAVTRATLLGVVVTVVKTTIVLVAVYGLTLSDQQTAALVGVTGMVISFLQRNGTEPIEDTHDLAA